MTEIFSDGAGNKYLGDCRWGNHDINYPSSNFLNASSYLTLEAGLNNLLSASGLSYRNVAGQSTINAYATTGSHSCVFASFGSSGDIDDRFTFYGSHGGTSSYGNVNLYNDGGHTGTTAFSSINRIAGTSGSNSFPNVYLAGRLFVVGNATYADTVFNAVVSPNMFSLLASQARKDNGTNTSQFFFACNLVDVNTEFNYYSASKATQSFIMFIDNNVASVYSARHYIANAQKTILQSGRAAYTISCSDGQTPGAQWATDMWVYDNNATFGYPVIGRVPNMLLGVGTYTYLKPVKIQGSVFPDNGSPWYLPVGTFSGKTLLMRCYSSMS